MTDFSYWTDNDLNYLSHHGVLGMKWGVRKDPREKSDLQKKIDKYSDKPSSKEFHQISNQYQKTFNRNKSIARSLGYDPANLDYIADQVTRYKNVSMDRANQDKNRNDNLDRIADNIGKIGITAVANIWGNMAINTINSIFDR